MSLSLPTLVRLLRNLLEPELHTALLLTPQGLHVASATSFERYEGKIVAVAGVAAEMWKETRVHGHGQALCSLGKILVVPLYELAFDASSEPDADPLLLLALNGSEDCSWGTMHTKANTLAETLAPLSGLYHKLAEQDNKLAD